MKFSQLVEYNKINNFLQKSCRKWGRETTISDKNCETRTPSPLIQCWLQVCLLISGLGCLAWLLQAWYNIESGGRGDAG